MNAAPTFIAGDWGTSHLRLFLCEGSRIVERREGPGTAQLTIPSDAKETSTAASFASIVTELTGPWTRAHGALPVWLSGMVGSRTGWHETAYLPCPADAAALRTSTLRFTEDALQVAIVPGLTCSNPHGAPDVLRGEETQIVGALGLHPELGHGRQVVVLPGTHAKWVLLEDGRIVSFQTGFSGELYELLATRSTLANAPQTRRSVDDSGTHPADEAATASATEQTRAFEAGAQRTMALGSVPLGHLLFEVRSRQLVSGLSRAQALAFLSGLIIAQDVRGALGLFGAAPARGQRVALIGAPELLRLYRHVLAGEGLDALPIDASQATLAGLRTLAQAA